MHFWYFHAAHRAAKGPSTHRLKHLHVITAFALCQPAVWSPLTFSQSLHPPEPSSTKLKVAEECLRELWEDYFSPVVFSPLPEGNIIHWSRNEKRNQERCRKWESSMCLNNTQHTCLSDPMIITSVVAVMWCKYSLVGFIIKTFNQPGVYEQTKSLQCC